jgi:hypothetical protein
MASSQSSIAGWAEGFLKPWHRVKAEDGELVVDMRLESLCADFRHGTLYRRELKYDIIY